MGIEMVIRPRASEAEWHETVQINNALVCANDM